MAARFWVTTGTTGGTGNWSDTQNWSATTGGTAGASVPGSADTATFNASSGSGTATVDSNITIQTLTMTGFTGTLAFGTNSISLNSSGTIYTADTTYTVTGTPVINVTSTGSTAITIFTNAPTEANSVSFNFTGGTYPLTFLGANANAAKNVSFVSAPGATTGWGGTWGSRSFPSTIYGNLTLSTNMSFNATQGAITFGATSGTQVITTNGKTLDAPITINGVGGTVQLADSLTLGSSRALTLTNGTFDGNTKTIAGAVSFTMVTGSLVMKNVSTTLAFTHTSGTLTQNADNTTGNYTFTAGTLALVSFKLTCPVFSSNNSNARTIAFGTGNITCNAAGGTLWTTATVTGLAITGTPTVNISNSGAVATTVSSGILTEAQAISFNFNTGTYSLTFLGTTSYSAKNVDFTGFAGTWAARAVASTIYGSLTLSTGMTFAASLGVLTFGATSGTQILTSNAKTIDEPITIDGVGGTVQLADALAVGATRGFTFNNGTFDGNNKTVTGAVLFTMATGSVTLKNFSTTTAFTQSSGTLTQGSNNTTGAYTLTAGTLNLASYQLTVPTFNSSNSNVRTIDFGTGNITCNSSAGGTLWTTATITNMTTAGTQLVNISNSGAIATTVTPGTFSESQSISFNFTTGSYTLTLFSTGLTSKNLNFTGFSGTWSPVAAGTAFIYGDLILSSTMTMPNTSFIFSLASTGTQTITSNGKGFDNPILVDGIGGTKRLVDAFTMNTPRSITHANGTLDLNGKVLSAGTSYVTSTGTKNITFNAGTILCPSATTTAFNNAVPAGFTTTAGTGTGKISMTGATAKTFVGGGSTYNCTLSNDGAGALTISGANTFTTIANGVQPTQFTFTSGTTTTVTNWNVSGISGSLVTIISSTAGTAATLSKASGTVYSYYVSLKDSAATGGASWYAAVGSTNVSGNSGWVFGVAKYWVGGTGNWSTAARWATSSGGVGGSALNLADAAIFDSLSGGGTSTVDSNVSIQTLTMTGYTGTLAFGTNTISVLSFGTVFTGDTTYGVTGTPVINVTSNGSSAITVSSGATTEANSVSFNFTGGTYVLSFLAITAHNAKNINFTGFAGTWSGRTALVSNTIYGDLTLSSGMTVATSAGIYIFGATSGMHTITSNGVLFDSQVSIGTNGVSSTQTVQLLDAMNTSAVFTHRNGNLDLNGKILTVARYATAAGTKNLIFNGGTLLNNGISGTAFNNTVPTGFTTTAGTGTGYIRMTGTGTGRGFVGGGSIYNCIVSNDNSGSLTFSGDNTFTSLANGVQPAIFTFTAGSTQTVTNWNVSGTTGNLVTIRSSTAGTPATLSKSSGTVSADYLSIQDSTALGGASWYAGANSTNVSGNSGWIFSAPPVVTAGGNFFFMF